MKLGEIVTNLRGFETENHARILVGFAIASTVGAAAWGVKAGFTARKVIDQYKKETADNFDDVKEGRITEEDYAKARQALNRSCAKDLGKLTIPLLVMTGTSIVCMVKAQKTNESVIATFAGAAAASKFANDKAMETLKLQREKEIDILGDSKAQEVQEAVVKEKAEQYPVATVPQYGLGGIRTTGHGSIPTYDSFMGVWYLSSYEWNSAAFIALSSDLQQEMYVTVAELYSQLEVQDIPEIANMLGWHPDDCVRGVLPVRQVPMMSDGGVLYIRLDYDVHFIAEKYK